MGIFLDRTKPQIRPQGALIKSRKPSRRDFVLWCSGCALPTLHTFEELLEVSSNTVDPIYECTRCGEHRQYGRENADGSESKDDGNEV